MAMTAPRPVNSHQSRSGLTCERLVEIESAARRALSVASERLGNLGLGNETPCEINFVASLLTGSNPEERSNLRLNGERVAGVLQPSHSGVEILYEAFHPFYRQRFTVAHELGHFYLHACGEAYTYHRCPVRGAEVGEPEPGEETDQCTLPTVEAEADAFAGAFLLPAGVFVEAVRTYGVALSFLAQLFQVSPGTVRNRLATLKLIGSL